ncbi:MAG: hypothetical protein A4E19_07570 [Nitrospira sp. SG-bin1]|nr:MAG: hypothetical protein A4E19_07570 [Nitrospira sp. SG-bin1]
MKLPTCIYHLAEAANWPSIQRDGLQSARRLMRAAGLPRAEQNRLERTQRLTHTILPTGVHIRDQHPMPPAALDRCLCGMNSSDWYATINARVFFWIDPDRLNRQKAACESRPQVVFVVDTAALIAAHEQCIAVTPINTGNARRKAARRGAATFVPLLTWMRSGWESEAAALGVPLRRASQQPVELTVLDSVADIMRFVIEVFPLQPGQPFIERYSVSTLSHMDSSTARCPRFPYMQ